MSTENANESSAPSKNDPESAMIPGKLNFIDIDDRDSSVIRGLALSGNCCGTEDYNIRETATEGIRCVFELGECVTFIPDTDATDGITVWILEHRDDQSYYEKNQFSDLMPGFAGNCILQYDPDWPGSWGDFYLSTEDHDPGYYDFVFVYEGKALATMLTRFYAEDELSGLSDEELDALTKG